MKNIGRAGISDMFLQPFTTRGKGRHGPCFELLFPGAVSLFLSPSIDSLVIYEREKKKKNYQSAGLEKSVWKVYVVKKRLSGKHKA